MDSTNYLLIVRGNTLASSTNREAVFTARNALRNIFAEANVHAMKEGKIGDPIPYESPMDNGNHTVKLVKV